MRSLPAFAMLAMGLGLAGCVAPPPVSQAPVIVAPIPQPSVSDNATRVLARDAVNREMAKRLPGVNVAPWTNCVLDNASTGEIAEIAAAAGSEGGSPAGTVAAIVQRPATSQCIARVAATA